MTWEDLTESEKGYIAGFLDGEGSICIHRGTNHISISFYNTYKQVIDWIAYAIKTKTVLRTVDKRRDKAHTKNNYVCYIKRQSDVYKFLNDILPYLKVKHEQAKLGIKFLEVKMNRHNRNFTQEQKDLQIFYANEMSRLNKGGKN